MRPAHPIERRVGIEYYASEADGTGGHLRAADDHFRVREIEHFDVEPIDADADAYPHLVVRATLHGWDTNDFVARLSDALSMSRERLSWAGTKDKRAVTTQLFSLRGVDPDAIPKIRGVDVEVVGRAGRSLEFGDLAGNAFEIVVSDPERPEQVQLITEDLAAFAAPAEAESVGDLEDSEIRVAVPNYFGQQRFGSRRPITHEVGLEIVRGDWEAGVMAYLGRPFEREPAETQAARAFVEETRDWQAALDRFPGGLRFERSMLHSLVETGGTGPEDFRIALETLPTNLQRLFVHAAQSYVFNRVLSERLARGLPFDRPVAGDVVCFAERTDGGDSRAPTLTVPDVDRSQRVTDRRVETIARHCARGRAFVTAPLVGTETTLAEGEPGEIERAVLDDVGLSTADFDLPGTFHSTGTRRAILVTTDLRFERSPLTFDFALPKGSYATVLLREYCKVDPIDLG